LIYKLNYRFVAKKIAKLFMFFLLAVVGVLGVIYASLAVSEGNPAVNYTFFQQVRNNSSPLVIAHRGGGGIAPENTLSAFERSVNWGVDVLELDIRSTADGELVVIHDATVDRTTDSRGKINEMTLAEVKKLDAGYRWTSDGGQTFPFRGKGITIPTLKELFSAFPQMRFNIEPKHQAPSMVTPLCHLLREHKLTDKTVVGSFNHSIIEEFRRECKEVATSASTTEAGKFLAMQKTGVSEAFSPSMQALQVPQFAGFRVVTKEFVEAAHERNLEVHVWTVNQTEDMQRLLDMGVDGIMTDYPNRLLNLLGRLPNP
jgi:glycerophosphoryl diester phosphodiesterase